MDTVYAAAALQDRRVTDGVATYEWVASTGAEDVNGLILDPSGWDLSHHHKFPLVLLNHRTDDLPIARAIRTWVKGQELRTVISFLATARALEVQALVDQGIITAMSVAAKPLEWDFNLDAKGNFRGIHSHRQVLVEESIVTIPANPEAVRLASIQAAHESFLQPILHTIRSLRETP